MTPPSFTPRAIVISPVDILEVGLDTIFVSEVLQGTLDLMILKSLDTLGPCHGYGLARRIQQISENALQLNQGTLYPALLRLEQKGWISSEYGESENKRRARFYSLTKSGKKQLVEETASWEKFAGIMQRVLGATE